MKLNENNFFDFESSDIKEFSTFSDSCNNGDLVYVTCVDILPHKNEVEEINKKLADNMDSDWKEFATFKDGLLFKFMLVENVTTKKKFVEYDGLTTNFPNGKYGMIFYHKLDFNQLFIGKADEPKIWKIEALKNGHPVEFRVNNTPPNWDKISPEDKLMFWRKACSVQLKYGETPLVVVRENGKFVLDFNSITPMSIGSTLSAYVMVREYEGKKYKFLKTYVPNPDPSSPLKYLSKRGYDYYNLGTLISTNPNEDPSKIVVNIYEAYNTMENVTDELEPF